MAIRLTFSVNKEPVRLTIYKREIYYSDRFSTPLWGQSAIRCIPKDMEFIKKITLSRNRLPAALKELFELTDKEQAQYDNAKTDEELAEICIYDTKIKGGILINKEVLEDDDMFKEEVNN